MEIPCKCGIERPGSISHGVRVTFKIVRCIILEFHPSINETKIGRLIICEEIFNDVNMERVNQSKSIAKASYSQNEIFLSGQCHATYKLTFHSKLSDQADITAWNFNL